MTARIGTYRRLWLLVLALGLSGCDFLEELYGNPSAELQQSFLNPEFSYTLPQPIQPIYPTTGFDGLPIDPETGFVRLDVPVDPLNPESAFFRDIDIGSNLPSFGGALDRVCAIRLVGIDVEVDQNTLQRDAEPFTILIGPLGATQAQAIPFARTPGFTPATRDTVAGEVLNDGVDFLTGLQFGLGIYTVINTANPPGGALRFNLTLRLRAEIRTSCP